METETKPTYRLLHREDIIEADDEFLRDDCETWARAGDEGCKFMVGAKYSSIFQPMRRKYFE